MSASGKRVCPLERAGHLDNRIRRWLQNPQKIFQPYITEYRVLEHSRRYSLIEARPLTGRRHQIRRHAKLAGHPIVGDRRYGSRRAWSVLQRNGFHRMALHAASLTFTPPGEKESVTVGDSAVHGDFRALLESDASDGAPGMHADQRLP